MSVELKILVPLEEWQLLKKTAKIHESCSDKSNEHWERLKGIEKEHQKCQTLSNSANINSLSTTEGAGTCVDESGDHRISDLTFVMPSTHENEQQNNDSNNDNFEKNVIVDKAIKVTSESNPTKTLSKSEILQHIDEKFKTDASTLLDKLAGYPLQFSYDSNGILSIFGTHYPGKEAIIYFM